MKKVNLLIIIMFFLFIGCSTHSTLNRSSNQKFDSIIVLKKDSSVIYGESAELKNGVLTFKIQKNPFLEKSETLNYDEIDQIEEKGTLSGELGIVGIISGVGLAALLNSFSREELKTGIQGYVGLAALFGAGGGIAGLIFPDNVIYKFE